MKGLKFDYQKKQHFVILVDNRGYQILKSYDDTLADALSDLPPIYCKAVYRQTLGRITRSDQ